MNIETKQVRNDIDVYLNFGWEKNSEVVIRHAKHHHKEYVSVRYKDMPHYDKLVNLEERYFPLKKKLQNYEPIEFIYAFITFIFFVSPIFIYIAIKSNEKKI